MKFIKYFEGIQSTYDVFLSRKAVDPIDATDNQKKKFDIIRKKLESDCQPYLKSHKNKFLLRGIIDNKLYGKTLVRKTVRTDRNPMNTHHLIQDLIDDIFEEKFSVRPRSSGLFTHTHYDKASSPF
jgi:hypothetical protein